MGTNKHGRKIYEACKKAIPVVFEAVARKHPSFVTVLRNTADEYKFIVPPFGLAQIQIHYEPHHYQT
jgi:hypothetical protein